MEEWLKARIRKYADDDIRQELVKRNLSWGQQAELVRQGVRLILFGNSASGFSKSFEQSSNSSSKDKSI